MSNGQSGTDRPDEAARSDGQRERDADERDTVADEGELALRARELRAQARETLDADLREEVHGILDAAEARDEHADARDVAANTRDAAASLHSFLGDDEYDAGLKARRSAAMDRSDSHEDRGSAAKDRSKLSGGSAEPPPDEVE